MADPNKIEVGDTVSVLDLTGGTPIQATVISLPDNQLDYWRMRMIGTNTTLFYVSLEVHIIALIAKA